MSDAPVTAGTVTNDASARRRAVRAGAVGNVLEWYDYAVYGYLATTIGEVFFSDSSTALLLTFATFGVGFVFRPLGSIVFGHIGDAIGRKRALVATTLLMGSATALIGLIPSYATIGILAPVLLVVLRLLQGFAAGGEWGGSTTFLAESATSRNRGFIASFQQATVTGGLLLGAIVGFIVTSVLDDGALVSWGWRLPFYGGFLLMVVGLYMRWRLDETVHYRATEDAGEVTKRPIVEVFQEHKASVGRVFGMTIVWTVSFYILLTYLASYLENEIGLSRSFSLGITVLQLAVVTLLIPVFGAVSDRVGRKPLLLIGCFLFIALPYPCFALLGDGSKLGAIALVIIFGTVLAIFTGPGPAVVSELFPTKLRYSGLSIPYSMAVAIFGGFAPFIATWLTDVTGSRLAPSLYIIAAAVVSFVVLLTFPETSRRRLD